MALIEKFFIVADHYPVKTGVEIIEGMFVKLDANGEVVLATGTSNEVALGVAADTKSTDTSGLPSTNDAEPGSVPFVNRVSDSFDETRASGRMTVYHSGGTFASNQFFGSGYLVNDPLYVHSSGKLTRVASASGQVVAYLTKIPAATASGVPGTDVSGDLSLGSYGEFKLVI